MYIDGYKKQFPTMTYTGGSIKLGLSLALESNYYCFSYSTQLYVDKKTLNMSNTPRDGFLATNNFYLPINRKHDLLDMPIRFEIKKLGMSNITLSWTTKLSMTGNLVGNCHNSEYCITGEIEE